MVALVLPSFATNRSIRVLSYNILQGGKNTDNSRNLQRVADVIRLFDPDIVGLQEVDRNTTRCGKRDIPAELARLTGLTNMAYGAAMPYQGGHYGNAILSRHPITVLTNIALPVLGRIEPRAALVVTVGAPAPFLLINTHLSVESAADREAQVATLTNHIADIAGLPVILAGDLNTEAGSPAIATLQQVFDDASASSRPDLTYPSDQPERQIDYVFLAPRGAWQVVRTATGAEVEGADRGRLKLASDHLPLFSELKLRR